MVLATPVLAITVTLIAVERFMHVGFFDPNVGGDPLLFQHLFWFYSHPAVYIMVLPGMAVVSEIVACFSRKRIFGYTFVASPQEPALWKQKAIPSPPLIPDLLFQTLTGRTILV